MSLPYVLADDARPVLGAIVLQADATLEDDLRRLMPRDVRLMVSRVPSGLAVTSDSLEAMAGHLTDAANLFPRGEGFDTIAYGCTSGAAQIGPERVAQLIRAGAPAQRVTEPVSALVAACRAAGVTRLALVSPYVEQVSQRLRDVLAVAGIATPVFASFDEAEEARVARISAQSLRDATHHVAAQGDVDAVFLSCTNLRTLDVIPSLGRDLDVPVWSSNLVLAWHMLDGTDHATAQPGALVA
ncbi:MAG: aspartate/glutamate racemase family protein [Rhodobacteraceae bacterium]|nr:aspartate/glutamate racemase family protein [Paracoccaceae bacterium]